MAQFARPADDIHVGSYQDEGGATTELYKSINEVTFSDADFVRSGFSPASGVYVCKLSPLITPEDDEQHILRVRHQNEDASVATLQTTIELRQDYVSEASLGTLIWTSTVASPNGFIDTVLLLDANNGADLITDYTNLYVRLVTTSTDIVTPRRARLYGFETEVPSAGGGGFTVNAGLDQTVTKAAGATLAGSVTGATGTVRQFWRVRGNGSGGKAPGNVNLDNETFFSGFENGTGPNDPNRTGDGEWKRDKNGGDASPTTGFSQSVNANTTQSGARHWRAARDASHHRKLLQNGTSSGGTFRGQTEYYCIMDQSVPSSFVLKNTTSPRTLVFQTKANPITGSKFNPINTINYRTDDPATDMTIVFHYNADGPDSIIYRGPDLLNPNFATQTDQTFYNVIKGIYKGIACYVKLHSTAGEFWIWYETASGWKLLFRRTGFNSLNPAGSENATEGDPGIGNYTASGAAGDPTNIFMDYDNFRGLLPTGMLTAKATFSDTGTYELELVATDDRGGTDVETVVDSVVITVT